MNAKAIPRIDIYDPETLRKVLPLRTPKVIYIDPCDTCNFHCKFCPTADVKSMNEIKGRGHGPMNFEVFKQIIDDLEEFKDPIEVIRLYKEGEPLLNKRLPEMVEYAKKSPMVHRVDTTTNASLLTPELGLALIEAGLDRINISVEGVNSSQYKDFSGITLDYGKFVENVAFFYEHRKQCEMNVKINGDILTPAQEKEFLTLFGDITDGIGIKHTIEYWPKFDGMKTEINERVNLIGGTAQEVMVCPYVFYEMCINSDGTHSLCRFDWNHAMLLDQHVGGRATPKKIWDSIVLWQFQKRFLKKERKGLSVLSCPNCGLMKQGVPENIDAYAAEILEEM